MILILFFLSIDQWVETTQKDFHDGWFSRNLYSSHLGDGAVEFVGRFDLDTDGEIDIPGCSWILWGPGYSTANSTYCAGGGGCDIADLDGDGYPEFITTQMSGPVRIFWGTPGGPETTNPTELECFNYNNEGIFVADFDKDGYLDLLASIDNDNAGVFWGSRYGYGEDDVTLLPAFKAGYNPEAADLNKDGWLDAIVITGDTYSDQDMYIYWGAEQGFSSSRSSRVTYGKGGPHGMSVADINRDGWLDLVYSGNIPDYGGIVWGSPDIYQTGSTIGMDLYLDLGHHCFGGSSVADLDNDGYLDIVFFGNDNAPPRIYWGGPDAIREDRYTDLGDYLEIGSGGIVADFNNDGDLDMFEYDHGSGGSLMFFGPGFTSTQQFDIGSHHGFSREIGNAYTREYKEEYYSSIYDTHLDIDWLSITWDDSCPPGSKIVMEVRNGEEPDTSNQWYSWTPAKNGDTYQMPAFHTNHRYLQYKVTFTYIDPAELPVLYYVKIEYDGDEIDDDGVIDKESMDLEPVTVNTLGKGHRISLNVANSGQVTLTIHDVTGALRRTLCEGFLNEGQHSFVWDGCDNRTNELPRGVYFVRFETAESTDIEKITLLR